MRQRIALRPVVGRAVLGIVLVIILTSLMGIASPASGALSGCFHAQGRLVNQDGSQEGSPGRMIGTISGDYHLTGFLGGCFDFDPVLYLTSQSTVEGPTGTMWFEEYAALDVAEQEGTNGAVLMKIVGGTGRWEGASGHLVLFGYFHTDAQSGQWQYEGEVCVP